MAWVETMSTVGLVLSCVPFLLWGVFAPAWFDPRYITRVANYVLPPMLHLRILGAHERVAPDEWVQLMRTPIARGSAGTFPLADSKYATAETLIFMSTLEHRLGASAFAGTAAGAVYGLTLDFELRHPIFLCLGVVALFCSFVNVTHALGTNNPLVNGDGRRIGQLFSIGFWVPIAVCLWLGFFGSREAAGL